MGRRPSGSQMESRVVVAWPARRGCGDSPCSLVRQPCTARPRECRRRGAVDHDQGDQPNGERPVQPPNHQRPPKASARCQRKCSRFGINPPLVMDRHSPACARAGSTLGNPESTTKGVGAQASPFFSGRLHTAERPLTVIACFDRIRQISALPAQVSLALPAVQTGQLLFYVIH
jgi:hypothetical protein